MQLEWKQLSEFKELPTNSYFLLFIEQEQTIFVGSRKHSSLVLHELAELNSKIDWDDQINCIKTLELPDDIKNEMVLEAEKSKADDCESDVNYKKINISTIVMTEQYFKKYFVVQYIVLPSLKGPFLKNKNEHELCDNNCPCKMAVAQGFQ